MGNNIELQNVSKKYKDFELNPVVRNEILDIFRKYIEEDETRSILLSTHITTDLEHISDYIVFIEKGKIVFDLPTNELLENYGIIKCSKENFEKLNKKVYIAYKKGKYQYEVLANDKSLIRSKYNIETIDKPSITIAPAIICGRNSWNDFTIYF